MTSKASLNKPQLADARADRPCQPCRSARRGRAGRAFAIATAGALALFATACDDQDLEKWPLPEALTRDGSGKLADLIPGDWEVICYSGPYRRLPIDIPRELARADLPREYAEEVPDPYFPEHQYAFILLRSKAKPEVLLVDANNLSRFEYIFGGEAVCQERSKAVYTAKATTNMNGKFVSIIMGSLQ